MTAGRTQTLAENSIIYWRAVVGQTPRSLVVLASVHEHTELILDSFWNVKPMQLGVHESRQTAVAFLGVTDNAHGSVQHSLQPVCNHLRRAGCVLCYMLSVKPMHDTRSRNRRRKATPFPGAGFSYHVRMCVWNENFWRRKWT